MAYCIAMTFISLKVFLVDVLEILNVLRIESMDGMCVAARVPAVTMISGSIFHPRALISFLVIYICLVFGQWFLVKICRCSR